MRIELRPYWKREDGYVLSAIAAAAAIAGAAVSAYGSYSSAQSQKQAANYNAQVAKNNAMAAEQQAQVDAQNIAVRNQRVRGQQLASMAAAGVAPTGSGADVITDSNVQGELNRLTTLYKGNVSSTYYQSQSQLYSAQASAANTAGYLSAGGTLLSGAGSAAYDYSAIQNNPRFNTWGSNNNEYIN